MRFWRILFLAAVAPLASGCLVDPNDCGDDDVRCDGAVAYFCTDKNGMYGGTTVSSSDCASQARVCVVATTNSGKEAFCAPSSTPDPRCPATDWQEVCVDNHRLSCRASYVIQEDDCGEKACVLWPSFDQKAECQDPNHPCFEQGDGWICSGDEAHRCKNRGVERTATCPSCQLNEYGFPETTRKGYEERCD